MRRQLPACFAAHSEPERYQQAQPRRRGYRQRPACFGGGYGQGPGSQVVEAGGEVEHAHYPSAHRRRCLQLHDGDRQRPDAAERGSPPRPLHPAPVGSSG